MLGPARRRLLGQGLAAVALISGLGLAGCGRSKPRATPVSAGAVVLALGDSLTHGVGAAPRQDWPTLLAEATGWQVVNAGVSGNTSAQALARLPGLLQEYQPELVIVGIGGNDFLQRQSQQQTEANIRAICQQCQAAGAQVMLVAMPALGLLAAAGVLSDHAMYARIASEQKLPLLGDAWSDILADERLRSDQVHANTRGYALFAQRLEAGLRAAGMLS
ncbi:arylesterase [Corticibacter populi]|uniref:Arylesterase n=2 Tax=Corticibacter populi TaxID=1550736 RepID=A0A3M6QP73_9BURK|nr:arylesterase [Corticibacter populi]